MCPSKLKYTLLDGYNKIAHIGAFKILLKDKTKFNINFYITIFLKIKVINIYIVKKFLKIDVNLFIF